ncbi:MAG TPA: hypothetical protein VL096_16025 [Pirellulaceae bacterium]|nr:hypothetical protein [Pirellulaceae bacterium]
MLFRSQQITALSLSLILGLLLVTSARGQQTSERLSDQEPFDRITLDEENQGAVIKVEPVDLPNRRVPANPNPDSKLRVKLYA